MQKCEIGQDFVLLNLGNNNTQGTVKSPKILPNILKRRSCNTDVDFANENPNETKTNEVQIQKIFLDSNDEDSQTYVLDQSEFVTLPLHGIENTSEDTTKNEPVQEIIISENEVHLLNKQSVEPQEVWSNVCRTCLTLIPSGKSKKLFDPENSDESDCLRKKLSYVAGEVDFTASVDPVLCSKCVTLLDIAYRFKVKVREVENRIEERSYRKNHVKTMVNLRSLIGKKSLNSREILEKNGNGCALETANKDVKSGAGVVGKHNIANNKANCTISNCTTCENGKILEDYLAKRESALQKFFSTLDNTPATFRYRNSNLDDPNSSLENVRNATDSNQTSDVGASGDFSGSSVPATPAPVPKVLGVQRLERTSSPANLFSNVKLRVKRANQPLDKKWVVLKEGEENRQITPGNDQASAVPTVEQNALSANKYRKKKPMVPTTYNLFDEAHDNYFKELEGKAGSRMIKKWATFSRKPPQLGTGPYLCELCGIVIIDRAKFQQHSYKHVYCLPANMCSYCGLFFKGGQNLNNHIMSKHRPPSFKCKICGKMFHLATQVSTHIATVHSNSQKRYQCHRCGKLVKYKYLRKHLNRHTNNTYTCEVCDKTFTTYYGLYRHKRMHFRGYKCKICGADFKADSSLRQHIQNVHEGIRWQCMICKKLMARKDHVLRHYQAMHGDIKEMMQRRALKEEEKMSNNNEATMEPKTEDEETMDEEMMLYEDLSDEGAVKVEEIDSD